MNKRLSFIKNLVRLVFSNVAILLSSILVGFILPKIMGVEEYGYYKLFSLYAGYVTLLHFGFLDGFLVKFAGKNIEELNLKDFRGYFNFFIIFELLVAVIIFFISILIKNNIYRNVFLSLSFYTFLINCYTYFQFLSQATVNFNWLSKMNIMQATINSIIVLMLLLGVMYNGTSAVSYKNYIILFNVMYCILLVINGFKYRKLVFGQKSNFSKIKKDIIVFFKIGIPITLSYQIANLILNLDNQYISIFFSNRVFSLYSFAYSLISMTTTVVSAISTVFFPYLNRKTKHEVILNYTDNVSIILLLIYFIILIYYPVHIIVYLFLPDYIESLTFFKILLPGVGISSCISLVIFNYYKVLNESKKYLVFGIFILMFSIFLDWLSYVLFQSPLAVAVASLVELLCWYIINDLYLSRKYNLRTFWNLIYICVMTFIFELVSIINNPFISLTTYLLLYLIVSFYFKKKVILNYIGKGQKSR